ncbi:MAG: hypothetical protein M3040_04730, partial [Bacteroidota bacterium]|nr:hypothetical protein [Bacteroidota bacterium]
MQDLQNADIAEVKATIKQREADDLLARKHYQMLITIDTIIQFAPEIKTDIFNCLQLHLPVF